MKENTMKQKFSFAFVCAAALALTGCASTGNEALRYESEAAITAKIVEGKTTKSEIRRMYGSPLKTTFTDGGLEIATYEFTNVSSDFINYVPVVNLLGSSASGTKKELIVLFDRSNVVMRFSMSESAVKQKTGLFNN